MDGCSRTRRKRDQHETSYYMRVSLHYPELVLVRRSPLRIRHLVCFLHTCRHPACALICQEGEASRLTLEAHSTSPAVHSAFLPTLRLVGGNPSPTYRCAIPQPFASTSTPCLLADFTSHCHGWPRAPGQARFPAACCCRLLARHRFASGSCPAPHQGAQQAPEQRRESYLSGTCGADKRLQCRVVRAGD